MSINLKTRAQKTFETAVALAPWLIAMYTFYWLDSSGTWTNETPHRGKISVAILAGGMLLSFLLRSHFTRVERK